MPWRPAGSLALWLPRLPIGPSRVSGEGEGTDEHDRGASAGLLHHTKQAHTRAQLAQKIAWIERTRCTHSGARSGPLHRRNTTPIQNKRRTARRRSGLWGRTLVRGKQPASVPRTLLAGRRRRQLWMCGGDASIHTWMSSAVLHAQTSVARKEEERGERGGLKIRTQRVLASCFIREMRSCDTRCLQNNTRPPTKHVTGEQPRRSVHCTGLRSERQTAYRAWHPCHIPVSRLQGVRTGRQVQNGWIERRTRIARDTESWQGEERHRERGREATNLFV